MNIVIGIGISFVCFFFFGLVYYYIWIMGHVHGHVQHMSEAGPETNLHRECIPTLGRF